jgi:hypothetical protein
MNDTHIAMTQRRLDPEALQARYAARVVARLSAQSELTGPDLSERLRFARERALDRARLQRAATPSAVVVAGSGGAGGLVMGGGLRPSARWWVRLGAVLPLLALVAGLVLIQNQHVRAQIAAAAEIDFDLLLDDLPPAAYSDPGFLEFLKAPRD